MIATVLTGYRCASCGGVAHPSTGHQHSPRVLICHGCAVRWFAWLRAHTRPRKGTDFYGAATKDFSNSTHS